MIFYIVFDADLKAPYMVEALHVLDENRLKYF